MKSPYGKVSSVDYQESIHESPKRYNFKRSNLAFPEKLLFGLQITSSVLLDSGGKLLRLN